MNMDDSISIHCRKWSGLFTQLRRKYILLFRYYIINFCTQFRCGRLVYYIPFPRSYVRYRIVEAAIVSAYLDEPCGPCPTQATLKDASDHLAKHGIKIAMDSSKVDVKSDEAEEDNSSGEVSSPLCHLDRVWTYFKELFSFVFG